MGSGASIEVSEEALEHARQLDVQLAKQKEIEKNKVKLLLLGAGESGKSTVFKQMKLIYGNKFSETERKQNIPTLHTNIMLAMKTLCDQAVNMHMVDKIEDKEAYEKIRMCNENDVIKEELGTAIGNLWRDPGLQAVWKRRSEFQVVDSVQYYFNKIDEIKKPEYVPDDNDILYLRVRTSGNLFFNIPLLL